MLWKVKLNERPKLRDILILVSEKKIERIDSFAYFLNKVANILAKPESVSLIICFLNLFKSCF